MLLVGNSDNTRSCFKTDVKTIRTSRLYQQGREYVHKWNVEFHTGIKQPKEQVERRAAKNREKKRTIETRKLMSEHCWCNGRSLDESIKKKISESTKLAMQNMDSEKKQLMCEKYQPQNEDENLVLNIVKICLIVVKVYIGGIMV